MTTSINTNLTNVVTCYLQQLNVNITKYGLAKQLEQNPYFPSLYGIKNVLDKYKIPNEAFTIEADHLDQLETPFIAYCNQPQVGKDFILVTKINPDSVSYISNNNKEKKISRLLFLDQWQKIVLVAEPGDQSIEPNYEENLIKENADKRKKQWLWAAACCIISLVCLSFLLKVENSFLLMVVPVAVTKMAGCVLAVLLLIYEIDNKNHLVKKICSAGLRTNCDSILSSKASGIAGLKWSEAGFFYFTATLLFLLNPAITPAEKIPWLAIAAAMVSPYILFSVYYQYKIAKQWCPLCLAVQGVLLLELVWAITVFVQNKAAIPVNTPIVLFILTSILLPVTIWFAAKPVLERAKESAFNKSAYLRLLYNPEQFNQLLKQQPKALEGWQQMGIDIGNPNAPNCIVKVCNPYCKPCAQMHSKLEEVIGENDNIRVKIIFNAQNSETDRAAKPVKHLLAIASKNNPQLTQQALDAWYGADIKDYEFFARAYPMNGELMEQEEKIELMDSWCRNAGINATPTIFINGRALPENYDVEELKNIL
jgi:uncharacterized membrane protein/thiol-disulfide isomerase/thioredoxin